MQTVAASYGVLAPSGSSVTRGSTSSKQHFTTLTPFSGFRRLNHVDRAGQAGSGSPQTLQQAVGKAVRRSRGRTTSAVRVTRMMFERFTEKAIKVVMLAQEEARRLGHNFVGTEQILLGLIGESTGWQKGGDPLAPTVGCSVQIARLILETMMCPAEEGHCLPVPLLSSVAMPSICVAGACCALACWAVCGRGDSLHANRPWSCTRL